MTSMIEIAAVPDLLMMASHEVLFLPGCLGAHNLELLFLFHLLSCSLACPCMTIVHMVMHMPDISSPICFMVVSG